MHQDQLSQELPVRKTCAVRFFQVKSFQSVFLIPLWGKILVYHTVTRARVEDMKRKTKTKNGLWRRDLARTFFFYSSCTEWKDWVDFSDKTSLIAPTRILFYGKQGAKKNNIQKVELAFFFSLETTSAWKEKRLTRESGQNDAPLGIFPSMKSRQLISLILPK